MSNWPPQEIFSPDQVTVTDVPGDGNCMFYSLFCGDTNLENVRMVRKRLMDELISMRYEECMESSYSWEFWTMSSIADRNNEVGMNGWVRRVLPEAFPASRSLVQTYVRYKKIMVRNLHT